MKMRRSGLVGGLVRGLMMMLAMAILVAPLGCADINIDLGGMKIPGLSAACDEPAPDAADGEKPEEEVIAAGGLRLRLAR